MDTMAIQFPHVTMLPLSRFAALLDAARMQQIDDRVAALRARLAGRVVWNVSSTAVGGGVAEMVRSLLAYARGAGVEARWAVIEGTPEFFQLTKRLHNALHGSVGDGSPLGDAEQQLYERVTRQNAAELVPLVRPRDVVVVHDPQPAGMMADLARRGAMVIWRCHIGHDRVNAEVERGWRFLAPHVQAAAAYVFSRAAYVPAQVDAGRSVVITPSIDPFSPKNQPMADLSVRAILARIGIIAGSDVVDGEACCFTREDGAPGRVDRQADVVRQGAPPSFETPLVVQVSRWDQLKDPIGVLHGFARIGVEAAAGAQLVLAGPDVRGVSDDPEGAEVYQRVVAAWRALPLERRRRVQLVSLPTVDIAENAAMVNALQRHATMIVQKSLHEGFGLTVTEAMWKARPVLASAVGGIRDQIDDGVDGLLIADPTDLNAFAAQVVRLLGDAELARRLGANGHARVLERYLGIQSLLHYGALIEQLDGPSAGASATAP